MTAAGRDPPYTKSMPRYVRAWVPGGTFFFTVALLQRDRSLLVDHIAELRAAFLQARSARPFQVDAIVVLPEHLHCIWTLPPDNADFSTRWRRIKGIFSKSIEPDERLSARRKLKQERGVWQRRFWEHVIRDERDLETHADYIHYNPVKHGHVQRVADWPHSSFHRFVKAGIYAPDWAGTQAAKELDKE